MAKIIDDFGYIIKVSEEDLLAISLVDNGINPYKNIKKKSLQHKVRNEHKRRLIINIIALIKKSLKNRSYLIQKLKIKTKSSKKSTIMDIQDKLSKFRMKKIDKIYKDILHHGITKKHKVPKSSPKRRKTQKKTQKNTLRK